MAKKKSETPATKSPAGKAPVAKKEPAKRPAAAAKKPAPAASPLIDTSMAANAAAAMIAGKVQLPSGGTGAARKESAAFKQLKAGLNKPAAGALGGAFTPQGQQKKSIVPLGGPRQVGHNQTFGADVNRAGVPRRTPG